MYDFLTLDDVEVAGKTVFLRVDINSPIDPNTMRILDASRIQAIIPTVESLREARVIIGAHQSRPGRYDFTSLESHGKVLQMYLERKIQYTDDIVGEEAQRLMKGLKPGDILLLNNVRMLEEENRQAPPEELRNTRPQHRGPHGGGEAHGEGVAGSQPCVGGPRPPQRLCVGRSEGGGPHTRDQEGVGR